MLLAYRRYILIGFAVLAAASVYFALNLKFSFDFEQFFPRGDEDLAFFLEFIDEFETDDSFLLVALERKEGVFDSTFLEKVHDFSLVARDYPYVERSQSITQFSYPVKTPFGITSIPAIHRSDPSRYASDRERALSDPRLAGNLINEAGTALVVFLKTKDALNLDESRELMAAIETDLARYDFPEVHMLGRAYFSRELVDMQIREVAVSTVVSGILVSFIMFLIFRRVRGILIALVSIALGLLLFFGLLGALGREMNAIAALYPVLMIIVGTSDVIHIMSKYIDELRAGQTREAAIKVAVREIGLATLLTSITTAVGFATLFTSRVNPIRDFGINAALGVLVAYLTVIFFTTTLLSYYRADQLIRTGKSSERWHRYLTGLYEFTRDRSRLITGGALVVLVLCAIGISRITTNYSIVHNLPRNSPITTDFLYFEKELSGFRPLEFAISVLPDSAAVQDYAVLRQIADLENYLAQFPYVRGVTSITSVYRSINQMNNNDRADAFILAPDSATFRRQAALAKRVPKQAINVLVSRDGRKARISSRLRDIGADSIKVFGQRTDDWIAANLDTNLVEVRQTGTGLIIDKNSEYIRTSLLWGLGLAIFIVSALMALLFRRWRMLIVALVPNLIPLVIAGATLGFLGIELEAGVSIVFAVIFGIAVDDTIHFLSKYKLVRGRGKEREEALLITFRETGKAIILTSVILFFGFLVMLFSIHPPSVTIGLLISLTLASAVIGDLLLIPIAGTGA